MSDRMKSGDTPSTISLLGLEDGAGHCASQAGRTNAPFSLEARPASRSAQPESVLASKTNATLRPTSSPWSQPSGLLSSLANRLQPQSTRTTGSMIYSMRWSEKVTPRGRRYLATGSVGAPHIRQRLWFVAERLADSISPRLERRDEGAVGGQREAAERGSSAGNVDHGRRPSPPATGWNAPDWLFCRDGKWRTVEPGTFPLVNGLPTAVDGAGPISRVGTLKGAGNAIVPQVAAEIIKVIMEQ